MRVRGTNSGNAATIKTGEHKEPPKGRSKLFVALLPIIMAVCMMVMFMSHYLVKHDDQKHVQQHVSMPKPERYKSHSVGQHAASPTPHLDPKTEVRQEALSSKPPSHVAQTARSEARLEDKDAAPAKKNIDDVLARLQKKMNTGYFDSKPEIQQPDYCPVGDRSGVFAQNGDHVNLGRFFERLLEDPTYSRYKPTSLSRDPWIIQFDAFLSEDECANIIQDCPAWTPDALAGGFFASGYRNSSSCNCRTTAECDSLPGVRSYRERIAEVLEIGLEHTEGLNILKYETGGFYKRHHDFIMAESKPRCHANAGPRILTFMAYLTDVEEGGSTNFFHLGIDVLPKPGRVLLWADTRASNPLEKDERTAHEALVVRRGTKIVATTWVRQYEAQKNLFNACCEEI